jgi:YD repeat-containing protein
MPIIPVDFFYGHYSTLRPSHVEFPYADDFIRVIDSSHVTVHLVSLQEVPFTISGSTGTPQTAGIKWTLVKNADGTYDLGMASDPRSGARDETLHFAAAASGTCYLASLADKNGNTLTVSRDGSHQATTLTDGVSRTITLGWTGSNLTSVTDPAGNVSTLGYDASSYVTTLTPAGKGATTLTYNTGGCDSGGCGPIHTLNRVYWASGPSDQVSYTSNTSTGQPSGVSSYQSSSPETITGTGSTWTHTVNRIAMAYTFNADGTVAQVSGPNGTTSYTYDGQRNVLTTTSPDGVVETWTYNTQNMPLSRAALAGTTTWAYDATGQHVTSVTNTDGIVTTYTLDTHYNATSISRPDRGTWTLTRNSYGQVTQASQAGGVSLGYSYDAQGYPSQQTRGGQVTRDLTNNVLGLPTTITDHKVGTTTTYQTTIGYDGGGRATAITPPSGNWQTTYNGAGRPTLRTFTPTGASTPTSKIAVGYSNGDPTSLSIMDAQTNGYSYY